MGTQYSNVTKLQWSLWPVSDVDQARPDEKSVITYVASYYHTFARMKNEMKGGRRIANVSAWLHGLDCRFGCEQCHCM
jgi:hypothetical protein